MLKAYAIGFFGAVAVILVVAGIVFVTQPKDEPGLLWGGEVYTTKEAFEGYLKEKGLSYKVWLARNPGAAPWEPKPGAAAASAAATTARNAAPRAADDSTSALPLATLGLVAIAVFAVFLLIRLPHPTLPRIGTNPTTVVAPERSRATSPTRRPDPSRVADSAPRRNRLLPRLRYRWNVSIGEIAFWGLTFIASGAFAVLVALLASA